VLPVGLLLGQDIDRSPWGSIKRTHRPEHTKGLSLCKGGRGVELAKGARLKYAQKW
jgi:hypothetical protein